MVHAVGSKVLDHATYCMHHTTTIFGSVEVKTKPIAA
jgi:hypothetical protein